MTQDGNSTGHRFENKVEKTNDQVEKTKEVSKEVDKTVEEVASNEVVKEVVKEPKKDSEADKKNEEVAKEKEETSHTKKKADTLVSTKEEKTMAALGYLYFLCVLPLTRGKGSAFCEFHGKQALILAVLFFILLSVLSVFSFLGLARFLWMLLFITQIVVTILGFMNASKGKTWRIPFICKMADKLTI